MKKKPDALNARCLAGVLLWTLAAAALRADDGVQPLPAAAVAVEQPAANGNDAPTAAVPAAQPVTVEPLAGPLSLTLSPGIELALPEGWHWVGKAELKPFMAASGRSPGAWDLGMALTPGEAGLELRLLFEPMGLVEAGDPGALAPDALLLHLQEVGKAANERHRSLGQAETAIAGWAQPPLLDLDGQRLTWAERLVSGTDERIAWHGRLRSRAGIVKLDLAVSPEQWDVQGPQARALFEALSPQLGQGLVSRQSIDRVARMDLPALVVDGVFGRGALAAGASEPEEPSVWARLAAWAAAALALAAAGLWAWRRLRSMKLQRIKDRLDEARLAQIEKDLGGNAEDVEEIVEDEDRPPE